MITVNPMGQRYAMVLDAGEEKVTFFFDQLSYFARNKVSTKSTSYNGGKIYLDVGLAVFYNLKYALKDIKGLQTPEGEEYKLSFEKGEDCLTDKCVDELLALSFSDLIIYAARDLSANIPEEITDPVTGKKLEGIEVLSPSKLKDVLEKK
jgi:hypothetical protein